MELGDHSIPARDNERISYDKLFVARLGVDIGNVG